MVDHPDVDRHVAGSDAAALRTQPVGRARRLPGLRTVDGNQPGFDSRLAGGTGHREKLRYSVMVTMCAGAVVGATMTRFTVALVIAMAAVVVAISAGIFWFGPPRPDAAEG